MKTKNILFTLAALAVASLSLSACKESSPTDNPAASPTPTAASPAKVSPSEVEQAAFFASSTALTFAVSDPAKRSADAAMAYAAASALNGLATGQAFTPEDVRAKLATFGGKAPPASYALIASGVTTVWATIYPRLPASATDKAAYMAALASGVQRAAAPFLPPPQAVAVKSGGPVVMLNGDFGHEISPEKLSF